MKTNSYKHNKLKNTGILFELLTRQITNDVMERKEFSVAEKLLREHFSSKTELGKELILYRAFFNTQQLSESKSFEFIKIIGEQRQRLNEKLLNTQKYLFIKQLKEHYNLKEFLSVRIPSYKIHASIYKMFDAIVNENTGFEDIEDIVNSKFTIVEHLSGQTQQLSVKQENAIMELVRNQDEDLRLLSYSMLLKNFNERYKNLSEQQKFLLREYMYNVSNINTIKKYVTEQASTVLVEIKSVLHKVNNKVTKIKLQEVISQLQKMQKISVVKENHITAMLIAYQIVQELKTGNL
jgi:hypothetical protein